MHKSLSESVFLSFQSETRRLENEIEEITRKLEQERRSSNLLNKDLEEVKKTLESRNLKQKKSLVSNKLKKKDERVDLLENKLSMGQKRLSELRCENKLMQDRINSLRKDRGSLVKTNIQLEKELVTAETFKKSASQTSLVNLKAEETNQSNIQKTQNYIGLTRSTYSQKIGFLSSQILAEKNSGARYLRGAHVNLAEPTANASEIFQISKNQVKV